MPNSLVIVEGVSDEILLPYFAACLNLNDWLKETMIIAAGGANKVVKKYMHYQALVNLPIICLLDNDAKTQYAQIDANLRAKDSLFTLKEGEIEDLFQIESLVSLLNDYLSTLAMKSDIGSSIQLDDFPSDNSRKLSLEKLWRQRKLGNFDKVGFAKFVAQQEKKEDYLTIAAKRLINLIAKRA